MPRPRRVRLTNWSRATIITYGRHDDDDLIDADVASKMVNSVLLEQPRERRSWSRPRQRATTPADDERGADGRDEEGQPGALRPQRPVGDPLEEHRGAAASSHGERPGSTSEDADEHEPGLRDPARLDPQPLHGEERAEGADHEDLGVGEVDQAQHAVDEGVAERDQRVDRARGQPVDGEAPELLEAVAVTQDCDIGRFPPRGPRGPGARALPVSA